MRRFRVLVLCAGVFFSLFSFAQGGEKTTFSIPKASAQREIPNIFRPIGDFFRRVFGKKRPPIVCSVANVIDVTLSQSEIITACSNGDSCSSDSGKVIVTTEAVDPENDILLYAYAVSAGRIVGLNGKEIAVPSKFAPNSYDITKVKSLEEGAKVVWDLTGVKPGTYTITAAVDDGCGFCGTPKTTTVTVKECADCK